MAAGFKYFVRMLLELNSHPLSIIQESAHKFWTHNQHLVQLKFEFRLKNWLRKSQSMKDEKH